MWILFEGGYYSRVDTIIFTHVVTPALTPSDGAQTRVDDEETCIAFPNSMQEFCH